MIQHKIEEKLRILASEECFPPSEKWKTDLNNLDRIKCEGMRAAEKRCRKIRAGIIAYSPAIASLGQRWSILRQIKKVKILNKEIPKGLMKEARRLDMQAWMYETYERVKNESKAAEKEYKSAKDNHIESRKEFLINLEATNIDQIYAEDIHAIRMRGKIGRNGEQ